MITTLHKAIADHDELEIFIEVHGLDPDAYKRHIEKIRGIARDLRTCVKEIEMVI